MIWRLELSNSPRIVRNNKLLPGKGVNTQGEQPVVQDQHENVAPTDGPRHIPDSVNISFHVRRSRSDYNFTPEAKHQITVLLVSHY